MNQQQYLPSEDPLQQLLKVNHMLHLLQIIIATFLMGDESCQSFAKKQQGITDKCQQICLFRVYQMQFYTLYSWKIKT